MTKETINERWERVAEDHYLVIKRKTMTPVECLAEAIKVLKDNGASGDDFCAEHDIVYLPGNEEDFCRFSDETIQQLARLGVHFDTEAWCFAMHC